MQATHHIERDDRPPRGAKRFVNRIREIIDEHYERGLGSAGVVAEVKAALREMDRRNAKGSRQ